MAQVLKPVVDFLDDCSEFRGSRCCGDGEPDVGLGAAGVVQCECLKPRLSDVVSCAASRREGGESFSLIIAEHLDGRGEHAVAAGEVMPQR